MAEWTEQEVYDQLASRSIRQGTSSVLTLAAIETVVFDARFPLHLVPWATQLMRQLQRQTKESRVKDC